MLRYIRMISRRLNMRRGFAGQAEGCVVLVVLALFAAVLVPRAWDFYRLRQDKACLVNMVRLTRGGAPGLVCPRTDQPYRVMKRDPETIIACPASPPHLPLDPRLRRTLSGTAMQPQLALRPDIPDPPAVIPPGVRADRAAVSRTEGGLMVDVGPRWWFRWWFRWVLAPIIVLGVLIITVMVLVEAKRGQTETGCLVLGLVIAVPLVLLIGYKAVHDERIFIPGQGGRLEIQNRLFGRAWSEPERLDNVVMVTPLDRMGRYYRLAVVDAVGAAPEVRVLFSFHRDGLDAAGLIERALFPGNSPPHDKKQ